MAPTAQGSSLPNIQLNIVSQAVYAKPRKMRSTWSVEAVDDLIGPQLPTNILDLLNDALEDQNYDPSDKDYRGRWRWSDGRLATPEEVERWHSGGELVALMATEMTVEIDREIMAALSLAASTPIAAIPVVDTIADELLPPLPDALEMAIASTPVGAWCKDAARLIYARNFSDQ